MKILTATFEAILVLVLFALVIIPFAVMSSININITSSALTQIVK